MKYNKNHGISISKKYVSHEHVEEGKKCDLLSMQKDQRRLEHVEEGKKCDLLSMQKDQRRVQTHY